MIQLFQRQKLIISIVCLLPVLSFAQAPVVDGSENYALLEAQQQALVHAAEEDNVSLEAEEEALVQETQTNQATQQNENAILLDKLQALQQEVQDLRGQIEVQAHDLKLLQEQQLAFYKDLDSRLHHKNEDTDKNEQLATEKNAPMALDVKSAKTETAPQASTASNRAQNTNPADEQISYLAAYDHVKNKQYEQGILAMQDFIQQYPQSGYVPNAQYWLGELFLVQKKYPEAVKQFDIVLQKFPSSSKAAACLLKKGYALVDMGQVGDAKKVLYQVVKKYPDTNSAQLANSKLKLLNI